MDCGKSCFLSGAQGFFSTELVDEIRVFHCAFVEKTGKNLFHRRSIQNPQGNVEDYGEAFGKNRIRGQSLLLIAAVMSRMLSMISLSLLLSRVSTFWREDRTVVWSRPNS